MADVQMNADSLTLEETNKVRISLGLAPIGGPVPEGEDAPVDTDAIAEANFADRKAEMKRKKEEDELKEKIAKARNQRDLNAKLKGSTLGTQSKDDALDAKNWVKKQAKRAKLREKELAERRRKEMEESDQAVYDERDLAGLKVGHDTDAFETGEDVILTLKDSRVLGEDEDELQNVNLVDDAALKAAKERKRKAEAAYTGYDDDEFDENRIGRKADVLSKYDDEYSGGKVRSEGFRLGAAPEKKIKIDDVEDGDFTMIGQEPASKVKLNLDFAKDFEVSDYAKDGDAGFKKLKKKKAKRSTRKIEDGEEDDMQVEGGPSFQRRVVEDTPQNLVDDDDLQAALARSRRENAKRKTKVKPEDLALQIASQRAEDIPQDNGDEDGRITFDDTSEFVRNVNLESVAAPVRRERAASPAAPVVVKIERGASPAPGDGEEGEVDEDVDMESDDEDEALAEMAAREGLSLDEYRLKIDRQMGEIETLKAETEVSSADCSDSHCSYVLQAAAAAESEPVVGSGMAGVLSLLRNQGALRTRTAEEEERERIQKQKDLWLADHRRRQAERELERINARGGNKDQAQREWENKMREQKEAREALDAYRDYKPDVNIVYHDEFGRQMTPKEAWKSLSHKFHGKTSGRMKTEKRLKKIAEERKQLTMSAGDTPTGMTNAFARRQEKTGQAHMVLSVGNKGSVQMGETKPNIRR
ncbi:SART-1 protein [Naematelia encephala]|uniref:SART-1 protein n=1 Tax=Naematelia encephala TaxID=71784 RepID=A0A1Y2BF75_9TREE|nr:SART-1 protein [Naematelia encephala]